MDSNVSAERFTFSEIIQQVGRLIEVDANDECSDNSTTLLDFTVGSKTSLDFIRKISPEAFQAEIRKFESAFDAINHPA